jgi:hypothetical protein
LHFLFPANLADYADCFFSVYTVLISFRNDFANYTDTFSALSAQSAGNIIYTATLYSRSASFSEVFKSVEGLRLPIIKAQGTWNLPAGKSLV